MNINRKECCHKKADLTLNRASKHTCKHDSQLSIHTIEYTYRQPSITIKHVLANKSLQLRTRYARAVAL